MLSPRTHLTAVRVSTLFSLSSGAGSTEGAPLVCVQNDIDTLYSFNIVNISLLPESLVPYGRMRSFICQNIFFSIEMASGGLNFNAYVV
jgi:hypothetical protein